MKHLLAFVFTITSLLGGAYYSTPTVPNGVVEDNNSNEHGEGFLKSTEEEISLSDESSEIDEIDVPKHSFIERVSEKNIEPSNGEVFEVMDLASEIDVDEVVSSEDLAYVELDLEGEVLREALNETEEDFVDSNGLVNDMYYADLKDAEDYSYELNGGKHIEWTQEEIEMLEMD